MADFVWLIPLLLGFYWRYKAPTSEWRKLADKFTRQWAACCAVMIFAVGYTSLFLPDGLTADSTSKGDLLLVGTLCFFAIVTMLFILIKTLLTVRTMTRTK